MVLYLHSHACISRGGFSTIMSQPAMIVIQYCYSVCTKHPWMYNILPGVHTGRGVYNRRLRLCTNSEIYIREGVD